MIQPPRSAIRSLARQDEAAIVASNLAALAAAGPDIGTVKSIGRRIITVAKAEGERDTLVGALMNKYRLSTEEGVVLMCLAEALLRVPDSDTANALIRDKIAGRHWTEGQEDGDGSSFLIQMSAFGLSLGSATLLLDQIGSRSTPAAILRRMVRKSGEPVIRQAAYAAMKLLGQQFVMGENIEAAIRRANRESGDLASFDMLGEAARTAADAARYARAYGDAILALGAGAKAGDPHANHGISIKLSALHPRYEYLQADRRRKELLPVVVSLARAAREANVPLMIDAEESDRLEPHLDIFESLIEEGIADGWPGLGIVVQAYQKRATAVIEWVGSLARSFGVKVALRLVKGAYWDSEIKRAQVAGLADFPVFTEKNHTDINYMRCAQLLHGLQDCIYPAFATHNAMTIAYIASLFGQSADHELQRLHGMGEGAHDALMGVARPGRPVRVYAPVGTHRDLLAYLVRRLLENGANSSFVHQFADPHVTVEELALDPREPAARPTGPALPTGLDLYLPDRRNSIGHDLGEPGVPEALFDAMAASSRSIRLATPVISGRALSGLRLPVLNPATGAPVGMVIEGDAAMVNMAVEAALVSQTDWSLAGGDFRADRLERAADLIEAEEARFLSLAMEEAGKTLTDAIAEVREAVDFLRYYACEARRHFSRATSLPGPTGERNELILEGKGLFVCISPWNFPLAIFLGQVSAALVAGNAVIAKPAEQTPLIAAAAVEVLHRAGVPPEVLHFLPGQGETIGAALTSHPAIAGVCFTGSTEVARIINRTLADRDGPIAALIAETGGINAMIVDSTALPEQVARDAVASAFQSAGQRCSALRLLIIQRDVAEPMIEMIAGAMAELAVGNPADPATDVGPIIDAEAREAIAAYVAEAEAAGRVIARAHRMTGRAEVGHFVAPTLIRLDAISDLRREIFGPVLHVVTYEGDELDAVIDAINATGYGLTLGLHSRIDAVAAHVAARARVGNIYVNRNQIGAVVGVQPFGGRGLSGTGPKAGGPHYLLRFAEEKTVSTDVTAAGGNAALMAR
ncbi:bifunctional proline dehydrogenase/L-glutamate gamma-semialdehyde dehydrogenase PutA [Sphingomonas lacunae]|uniref:Bifunctional protein PutA n=1 Tax=Sphingomonas lacunae TaxID=2698828 RepID=A0A6M4ASS1_9SPHN|nr:bifunctional proline dehydrogenase/L-glutamate gamma-semialdehyde dehydrogenase PutA [Sphingomonas lacunae]QJQ31756.1 bifunctional proline dehydrogenase/L-glutamate gamma-semialdehyde dehydrogenase PutA [Sphingomonas lacunae]